MGTFFLSSILFLFSVIIIKLFYDRKNLKNKLNNLQELVIKIEATIKENNKHIENSVPADNSLPINNANLETQYNIEIQVTNKKKKAPTRKKRVQPRGKSVEPIQDKNTNNETPSKNSFLYGADDFGVMKKGVVLDDKSYTYDQKEDSDFEII